MNQKEKVESLQLAGGQALYVIDWVAFFGARLFSSEKDFLETHYSFMSDESTIYLFSGLYN